MCSYETSADLKRTIPRLAKFRLTDESLPVGFADTTERSGVAAARAVGR